VPDVRVLPVSSDDFRMTVLAADAAEIAVVRGALVDWLGRTSVAAERAGDVVLACYEAMANVVDHAYSGSRPGSFDISLRHYRPGRCLTATISDHGRWRIPTVRKGRGHGLPLLTALSDHCSMRTEPSGTTVRLGWDKTDESGD